MGMESFSLNVSQLLMTKFCHDIIGPIGAVNNGVEFIEEASGIDEQAFSLIASSATEALTRIQYYRYAYGVLKESGFADLLEKRQMIEAYYEHKKIDVDFQDNAVGLHVKDCQVLCNLLLIASSSLIRGGQIKITLSGDAKHMKSCEIKAMGAILRLDEDIRVMMESKHAPAPDTKTVQAYYTRKLMEQISAHASLTVTDAMCSVTYMPSTTGE